jgi:riboflavin biosynthesis pyrimidine reductase
MRQLLPGFAENVERSALAALYQQPGPGRWVRANMVSSLDGSAVVDGRSQGLGSDADKAVFDLLRGHTDVVLVGAGTARAEGYRALRPKPAYAEVRAAEGQRPVPVLAVVSGRLDLDPGSDLFGGTEPTVVVTHGAADPARRDELAEVADVVVAGETAVDLSAALDALAERGLARVLCEGGPRLLAELAASGLLDELCLTLSPQLVGSDGSRILNGVAVRERMSLDLLLEEDGVLLSRWATVR